MKKFKRIFKMLTINLLAFLLCLSIANAEQYMFYPERQLIKKSLHYDVVSSSGAYTYKYPIEIPKGRDVLNKNINLVYNNQNKNIDNLIGYGWEFDIPYIKRTGKKGVDRLYEENDFYSSLSGELQYISTSSQPFALLDSRKNRLDYIVKPVKAESSEVEFQSFYTNDEGSKILRSAREIKEKRTNISKTFEIGETVDGRKIYKDKIYMGDINYYDKDIGAYKEIDTSLEYGFSEWAMNSAVYKARIKKIPGQEFITFINDDQEINISLVDNFDESVTGELIVFDNKWSNRKIQYKNIFGSDIDLDVKLNDGNLIKDVVINNIEVIKNNIDNDFLEYKFKLTSNKDDEVIIDGRPLLEGESKFYDGQVGIVSNAGVTSYIWSPFAHDSKGEEISIKIKYEKKDGNIFMTKMIPMDWLYNASYPVTADAVISYYGEAGDGYVGRSVIENFSSLRGGTGSTNNYSSRSFYIKIGASTYNDRWSFLSRASVPFNTSSIPDDAEIISAKLYLWGKQDYIYNISGQSIVLTDSGASSPTSLTNSDYSVTNWTTNEYSQRKANISTSYYNEFEINQEGLNIINKTGYTMYGLRMSCDIDNTAPTYYQNGSRSYNFHSFEEYDSVKDPYIEIYYTARPSGPTSLLVNNEINLEKNQDLTPYFSAVYNDDDTNDVATHYQIQVSASSTYWANLMWDSGSTTLSANIEEGERSENIVYSGRDLELDGSRYYWRIKFWDNSGAEGEWSSGSEYFEMLTASTVKYASKNETTDSFQVYELINETYWQVVDKNGIKYKFGVASSSRQHDIDDDYRIYKWMLDEVTDRNGNSIKYKYYYENGQVYPEKIIYTNNMDEEGLYSLEFNRELRNDTNKMHDKGFMVESKYRINQIKSFIGNQWVKKYDLEYVNGDNGRRSLLSSIQLTSRDEELNETILPSTDFEYEGSAKTWTEDPDGINFDIKLVNQTGYDAGVRLLDINGDSLVDIISDTYVKINKGDGTGWATNTTFTNSAQHYPDLGFRYAEVNGDGLVDFVYSRDNDKNVYINNGSNWSMDSGYSVPIEFYGPYLRSIRLIDLNGDGLDDIVRSYLDTSGDPDTDINEIYVNKGDGTGWELSSSSLPVHLHEVYNGNDKNTGVRLVDVNSDGLIDVLKSTGPTKNVYINNGNLEWELDSNYSVPLDLSEGSYYWGTVFADINGDGLVDIMSSPRALAQQIFINKGDGTGWAYDSNWTLPEDLNGMYYDDEGGRLADYNGDGLLDFLYGFWELAGRNIYRSEGMLPDQLSYVRESSLTELNLTYKGSAENLNPDLPKNIQVVKEIAVNDGFGNWATTTYKYEGGDFYYANEYDKRLAGFELVTKTDPLGNITKTFYHQGNTSSSTIGEYQDDQSKIGRVYRVEYYDDNGNLHKKIVNKWENHDLGNDRDFVYLSQTLEQDYDGDTDHRDKATSYGYENTYGNKIQETFWGEVSGSDSGSFTDLGTDLSSTTIEYAASTTLNIVGLPSRSITEDYSGAKVSETKYYYDDLALGEVSKGNATKEEYWVEENDYIDIERTYNNYGLVLQEKDPRDKATNYTYDKYNLFVATSTNALGHSTDYYYDYSSGKIKKTVDANGNTFETIYDGLDRVVEEKQPDIDTPSTLVTRVKYYYNDYVFPRIVTKHNYLDASNIVENISYLDGFDRVVQERNETEVADRYAVKDYSYNKLGLLKSESLPYFSTGASSTLATSSDCLFSDYTYDALARVLTVVNEIGTTTSSYDQWAVVTTDAEGNSKKLYKDSHDNLAQVDEYNEASTYTTEYKHDLQGNLTKIVDALDNERNFEYDALSRLTRSEDLHAPLDIYFSSSTFSYDASGNLISKTDGKNQTIDYAYDDIGRVAVENYIGEVGNEIEYAYDNCENGIGRLCIATSSGAITKNNYNVLGLFSNVEKEIDGESYVTEFYYNRRGNKNNIINPDDSEVKYTFNNAGFIETVSKKEEGEMNYTEIVNDYDYNELSLINYIDYGNGVETVKNFNVEQLYRLNSASSSVQGRNIQNLNYDYDNVGNIINIIDGSDTNSRKNLYFDYDDLYRLTRASTTNSITSDYLRDYAYNAIGNITNKSDQGSYTYGGHAGASFANPHAVTSISGNSISYDDNGNLLADSIWSHDWDYRNRLLLSNSSSAQVEYVYDHSDDRVKYTASSTSEQIVGDWCDQGYSNKLKIAIDHNKISENLSNFPLRIHASTSPVFAVAQEDGDDIIFYDESGCNQLNHDLVKYDNSSGSELLLAYVNVLSVSAVTDTEIYLYYGNANASKTEDESNTWDGNFKMVQTMEDVLDSTQNSNDGFVTGATLGSDRLKGTYYDLDGSGDYITWGDNPGINGEAELLFEIVAEFDNNSSDHALFSRESGGFKPLIWRDESEWGSGVPNTVSYDDGVDRLYGSGGEINDTSLHYYACTWDATNKRTYIDASEISNSPNSTNGNTFPSVIGTDLFTGRRSSGGMEMDGRVYEVRISNNTRSTSYISANKSQMIDGDLVNFSEEMDKPTGITTTSNFVTTVYPNKYYNIDSNGKITKHIFAGDDLIATIEVDGISTSTYYIHTDHLGGSSVITDENGEVVQQLDYYPFGDIRINENSGFNEKKKFTGFEHDDDTDLEYAQARYYNANVGKFISVDPLVNSIADRNRLKYDFSTTQQYQLSNPQSLNSYSYVGNNPLKYTDPTGECFGLCTLAAIWAVTEIAMSVYDAYDAVSTVMGDASLGEKGIAVGGFVAGLVGPGGGYGQAGKAVDKAFDATKAANRATRLNPNKIRFTQDSIKSTFRDGSSVDSLIDGLKSGSIDPGSVKPIRVFEMDGKMYSLDNRRLHAYREAGIDIPTVKASPDEVNRELGNKFTTKNDGSSVKVRSKNP